MEKTVAAVIIALIVSFGAASNAQAVSLGEFDKASGKHQGEFIAATLKSIYNYYKSDSQTKAKAECMNQLYTSVDTGGAPKLINLLLNELDIARKDTANLYRIEEIVYGVVERECAKPATKKTEKRRVQ